jgi:hypothetical protein
LRRVILAFLSRFLPICTNYLMGIELLLMGF